MFSTFYFLFVVTGGGGGGSGGGSGDFYFILFFIDYFSFVLFFSVSSSYRLAKRSLNSCPVRSSYQYNTGMP